MISLRPRRMAFCCSGLLASLVSVALADNVSTNSAVQIARREATRSARHAAGLKAQQGSIAKQLATVKKRIGSYKTRQAANQQTVKGLQQRLEKATADEKTTQQALLDARNNIKKLEQQLTAAKRIAKVVEQHVQVVVARKARLQKESTVAQARLITAKKRHQADLAAVKPLASQLKAVNLISTSAGTRAKKIQQRLSRLEKGKVQADPKNAHLVHKFKHDRILWSCRFNETGEYVLAGAQDKDFHRWDLVTGSKIRLAGHRSWIRRFAQHPRLKRIVTGAYAGKLIWWDVSGNRPRKVRSVQAHEGYIRGVAISPDGQYVATGGNDLLVKVWSQSTGKLLKVLKGHKRHVYNVAFHPSGKHLISGDLMGMIKQWAVGSWKHERDIHLKRLVGWDTKFQADCGGVRAIDFGPGGKTMAIAGISKVTNAFAGTGKPTVILVDWKTGKEKQVWLSSNGGHCWGMRWHHEGNFIVAVCGSGGGQLVFWRPGQKKPMHSMGLPHVAYDVALHPDGLRLAVALYDKTLAIYDLGPKPPKPKKKKKK